MNHYKDYRRDELLEILWHLDEDHELTLTSLKQHDPDGIFTQDLATFSDNGILEVDGENITLTPTGKEIATGIIRRHRLAERLLTDVLGKTPEETENAACEFEHILAPELVESICTLLGHPKLCPHGAPIPKGHCCVESDKLVQSIVIRLSDMEVGKTSKVVLINTDDKIRMNKLLSLGIVPGVPITLMQKRPAIVVEVNQTQIALEKSVGDGINVWRMER